MPVQDGACPALDRAGRRAQSSAGSPVKARVDWSPLLFLLSDGTRPTDFPVPADPAQAMRGVERWREADHPDPDLAAFARALIEDPAGKAMLESVFGNSPFLTQCCLREVGFLRSLLEHGADATFAELIDALNREGRAGDDDAVMDTAAAMRVLRMAKRRAPLLIGLADIAGHWPLDRIVTALSDLADASLAVAIRHLLGHAVRTGEIEPAAAGEVERGCGLIVLGMGKLGARELNYSSDIDLILLYDPERVRYRGRATIQQCFARLARELVRILDERTADGYVFRTDLRLRPDPASTPPAISVEAALNYYESAGQNWERAALIKARSVAGDRTAATAFLGELRPFLWRKHLDFAAIQDIHSIKRQINAHRGGARIAIAGHNIKLGRGGIREIEFFAQTQQLIWGGRLPELRVPGTCEALRALAHADRIEHRVADEMIASYVFLRRVEHRLQMIDDAQTHSLPADSEGIRRLALFCGYATREDFTNDLRHHLTQVEKHYARLFEEAPSLAGSGNLVFTGIEDDPETLATLRGFGFAEPAAVAAAVRGWHHGRYRATRSQRAREILTELIPALLKAVGGTANPDSAFTRFDQFIARLPAGVQFFSLLQANPALLELIAEIMGSAPRLAEQLARQPILLDGVLSSDLLAGPVDRAALAAELSRALRAARDFGDVLDIARRWTNDRKFHIGLDILRGRIGGDAAGAAFADLAETVIDGLLPPVFTEFARAHGTVSGGEFAVIGLGKLGGREMTVTSDLDLVLIYDAPASVEASDGPRPLAVATYYARLSQRLINALTVLTPEGLLYEVDMRLRPSGSAGPIASSLAAFRRYHDELSWTWEHMALTRARPVAGMAALQSRTMALIAEILARPRDRDALIVDIAEMRERMAAQHPNPSFWDIKHRSGGLVDAEFMAQYLMLRHAAERPGIVHANTSAALAALTESGYLDGSAARELIAALALWRQIQGTLKLVLDGTLDEASAPPALTSMLARNAGAVDFAGLKVDMTAAAEAVRTHYRAIIEAPAAEARTRLSRSKPDIKLDEEKTI
jgi:[glutamine synthetase] adenylyltransferase / [glutamine synthetase]-adenylyl-L-tyrosine phosphorylase